MWIKVSPMKGVMRFGKKGKLLFRYIWAFQVMARIGSVAHTLNSPTKLGYIDDNFHGRMLKKYLSDPQQAIPTIDIPIAPSLTYEEEPIKVLTRDVRKLSSKWINMVKI